MELFGGVWLARLFALHGAPRAAKDAFFVNPRDRSQPLTYSQAMTQVRSLYQRASDEATAARYGLHSLRVLGYACAEGTPGLHHLRRPIFAPPPTTTIYSNPTAVLHCALGGGASQPSLTTGLRS